MSGPEPIYLDYNATTPLSPEVKAALHEAVEARHGNPSSGHLWGRRAREALQGARARVAGAIGAKPAEIVFTSGGSESNNLAIMGTAFAREEKGRHLVISAVEHPAVGRVCDWLARFGFETTRVPVDDTGRVDPEAVAAAIRDDTVLVSVMHAQNEVGTVQPVAEIAAIGRARGVVVHSDAAQSVGKIPVDVGDLGVDLMSVAGHKLYAPKGIGALFVREGTKLERLIHGAPQEGGRRAGTENVLLAEALGVAMAAAKRELPERSGRMRTQAERLFAAIAERIPELHRHGNPEHRLPNTLSLAFPGVEANALLNATPEIAASAGSACHTGVTEVSGTLGAMGVPRDLALGTIRLSTGIFLADEEIPRAVEALAAAHARLL